MARPANPNLQGALIEAGRLEFATKGLAEARIEDITRRAGVSKGAFYLHFESKEAMFEHIARDFVDGLLRVMNCFDSLQTLEPRELVPAILNCDDQVSEYLWEHRPALRIVMEGLPSTACSGLGDQFVGALESYMRATIVRHKETMEVFSPDTDPDVAALLLTGAIVMFCRRIVRSDDKPDFRKSSIALRKILYGGMFRPEVGRALLDALQAQEAHS